MTPISHLPTLAARVASFGLSAAEREPASAPPEVWPAFLSLVAGQKLTGLAEAAAGAGDLALTGGQRGELLEHHRRIMLWVLGQERRLLRLAEALAGAGIEAIVLKGAALAHTFYPDPAWRPFGDVDLLVRSRDWRAACRVLPALGYARKYPEPRPGFGERFGNAAVHTGDDGTEVDLHRTLVLGPFGLWMEPDELFVREAHFEVGGHRLRRLDDTAALLHACMHASLGFSPPLYLPLRDVAQLVLGAGVDWELLHEWARRWKLRAVMRHALAAAADTLGATLPPEARAFMVAEVSRQETRALHSYTTSRRRRGGRTLSTMQAIPGARSKIAYAAGLLFPSREFLAHRAGDDGVPSYLRRWVIPIRWLSRTRTRAG